MRQSTSDPLAGASPRPFLVILAAVAGLAGLFTFAPEAGAAALSVNPTKIRLSARAPTALLTVKNDGDSPLRVQLTVQAWSQQLGGEMQLEPTTDIVFFPSLLALGPGQARTIRIGTTAPFAATERSYRIFVEELPPPRTGDEVAGGVRMYTRLGIPIFLQPERPKAEPVLAGVELGNGALSFRIENAGTMHFVPESVEVKGLGADGSVAFTRRLQAWYVLSGGARRFTVPFEAADCNHLRSLAIEVRVGDAVLKEHRATPQGTCGH